MENQNNSFTALPRGGSGNQPGASSSSSAAPGIDVNHGLLCPEWAQELISSTIFSPKLHGDYLADLPGLVPLPFRANEDVPGIQPWAALEDALAQGWFSLP